MVGSSRAIGLKIQLQSFFQGVAVMATNRKWQCVHVMGSGLPRFVIVAGPGRYDLFIRGLVEGQRVRFSLRDRENPSDHADVETVKILGVKSDDRRLDVWFVDVEMEDGDKVTFYYGLRHNNGHIVELGPVVLK